MSHDILFDLSRTRTCTCIHVNMTLILCSLPPESSVLTFVLDFFGGQGRIMELWLLITKILSFQVFARIWLGLG